MRIAVPHNLGREEARRRLRSRSHEIADQIPGGMAQVTTQWEHDDRMIMCVTALGQDMRGAVELEDACVVFEVDLPGALSFVQRLVENAIRQQGQKLLA